MYAVLTASATAYREERRSNSVVISLSVTDDLCARSRQGFYNPKSLDSCMETFFVCACRLEVQMTSDIQAILQMLQRQSALGPPAYSTLASSPEYHKPAIRVQPVIAVHTQVTHTALA